MNSTKPSSEDLSNYLQPTYFVDSDNPEIVSWANEVIGDATTPKERAIRLYYDVRDGIFYNPYRVKLTREWLRASETLQRGRSFCIPKALLLAAGARAVGIPTRLGFADVRNHVTSKNLLEALKSDVFAFHGFVEFYLEGKWVKASPTFNEILCERAGVAPLEFDGETDALFQEYNLEGEQFMEIVTHHGTFPDFPHRMMLQVWQGIYPHLFEGDDALELDGDLLADLEQDRKASKD
ncbi:MAG: transglutaminase family protein [Deltaproteobacteria bacterium]|nr:MAG: transglutaminase family protein [Deltaproteobacteria bacterium]